MRRLLSFGLGTLCLVLSMGIAGCSHDTPGAPNDSGADRSTPADGRADAEADGNAEAGGSDAAVDQPPKTDIRLILSEKMVKLTEGTTALTGTFTVTLSQTSPNPFIVTVLTGNPNVATVVPETLEFAANDIGPKEVTIIPTTDDDTVDNATVVTLSSPETGSASITVDVKDSDMQTLIVPPRVAMTEGRSEPLSVRLFKRPASSVVVTLASSNPSKLTVGTTTMTFNAQNYSIPQTATLTALQDDDTNLDNVTVSLTATGNVSPMAVPVEITDDDAVNMDISPANLTLMERGPNPGTIMVRLTRPPSANVTVAVASSNALKATVMPPTLTFTADDYATAQTVQVTPVPDDDSRDEMLNVTFTATGVVPAPPMRTVAVLVDDPDNQALQVTPSMVSVKEGETTTFDVRLTLNPGASSTVSVFSQNPAKVEVTPPVLTFTTSNFSTAQKVTVKALPDEDLANDSVMLTLTGSAADNVNVPVAVTDDDVQAIQLIAPSPGTSLVMQETQVNGPASTSQVGVRLAFRPAAPVSVLLTSGNGSKLELSRSMVTFTPQDYASTQFVTLTAPHDNDMVDDVIELSATAPNATPAIPLAKLSVEIRDMDVLAFNVLRPGGGPISALTLLKEGGTAYDKRSGGPNTVETSDSFQITLTVVPERDVSVTIEPPTTTTSKVAITPSTCVLGGTSALTTGCTITVTAQEDQDAQDEAISVVIKDQAGVLAPRTVNVAVDDRDVQSLLVTSSTGGALDNPVLIAEGNSADVHISLAAEPTEAAAIQLTTSLAEQLALSAGAPCTIADGRLTTSATWQAGCTVTVAALQDKDLLEQNLSIRVNATGLGVSDVFVNVRKPDDDKQELVLSRCATGGTGAVETANPLPLALTEGGSAEYLCVSLKFRPDVTNTVTLTPTQMPVPLGLTGPNFEVKSQTGSTTLMFNNTSGGTGSYDTPQLVTISPLEDDNLDSETVGWDGRVSISVTPFANPRTLTVSMMDNDVQRIVFDSDTPGSGDDPVVTVNEKKQAPNYSTEITRTVRVKLLKIPLKMQANDTASAETLTITPSSSKATVTGVCSGSPASLTFTNVSWGMTQDLVITSCPDDDTRDETVTLVVHSNRGTPDRQITVKVKDQDQPYPLTVNVSGTGSVAAAADVNGNDIVNCRASSGDCSGSYEPRTMVTLTATTTDDDWDFAGWGGCLSGGGTSSSSTLSVFMDEAKTCTATFNPRLTVSVGPGGSVRSAPPATEILNCQAGPSGDCSETFPLNTTVHLRASASAGWELASWGGGCVSTGANTADVLMSGPRTCTTAFNPLLTVVVTGSGSGSVGGDLSCASGTCTGAVPYNTAISLSASPDSNSVFAGWSPTDCGSPMTLTGPKTCTATFTPN